jgi:hypothetical protein
VASDGPSVPSGVVAPWGYRLVAGPCFNRRIGEPVNYGAGLPEQQLATIGDIGVSQHWVTTPTGGHPIGGSVWTVFGRNHHLFQTLDGLQYRFAARQSEVQ